MQKRDGKTLLSGIFERCANVICLLVVKNKETVVKGVGVIDGKRWILAVEGRNICCRQSRIVECVDFHGNISLFFCQQIERPYIHIAVNENDVLGSLLNQARQQAKGIVDLSVEEYLLVGLCMSVYEIKYLLEFFIGFFLIGELF